MMDSKKDNFDFLKLQYQVLSNKQISHNALVWNTLGTLFVAQAFLWNICLDSELNDFIRLAISIISLLTSIASYHHFIRNRWMEIADSKQLEAIELLMNERTDCPAMIVHQKLSKRTIISQEKQANDMLERILMKDDRYRNSLIAQENTFGVWKVIILVITAFSAILFGYSIYLLAA